MQAFFSYYVKNGILFIKSHIACIRIKRKMEFQILHSITQHVVSCKYILCISNCLIDFNIEFKAITLLKQWLCSKLICGFYYCLLINDHWSVYWCACLLLYIPTTCLYGMSCILLLLNNSICLLCAVCNIYN